MAPIVIPAKAGIHLAFVFE